MPNNLNPRPLEPVLRELKEKGFSDVMIRLFRDTFIRIDKTLTDLGQVQSVAPVTGRTEGIGTSISGLAATGDINAATKVVGRSEGIGTTVTNIDATGKLNSTDSIAADGTGSPLTGGKRGFVALDSNNRIANSFRLNPVNVTFASTSSSTLTNNGISTTINVLSSSNQFPAGTISYNSGSVDPGAFSTAFYYVYALDPTFGGGAVTYQFTLNTNDLSASEGVTPFGSIVITSGASHTGGGNTGGSTGKPGGRGITQQ